MSQLQLPTVVYDCRTDRSVCKRWCEGVCGRCGGAGKSATKPCKMCGYDRGTGWLGAFTACGARGCCEREAER